MRINSKNVLEIVERLCTHIGIIHRGQLVAQGSIEQLRARSIPPPRAGEDSLQPTTPLTLEQIFLGIVGAGNEPLAPPEQELSWLS